MSVFASNFAASGGPELVRQFGELITYTPGVGNPRTIMAIVRRRPPAPLPGSPMPALSQFIEIVVLDRATSVADDGLGGIAASELDTGLDTVTLSLRVGTAAEARGIKQLPSQRAGMLRLEVR